MNVKTINQIEEIIDKMLNHNLSKYQAIDKLKNIANRNFNKIDKPQVFQIENIATRGSSVVCELVLTYAKIGDTSLQNKGEVLIDYIY